jgi:ubiquinone/menaquinone biosynthesis C-methylase UbiE
MSRTREESTRYWDQHPIGVEIIGGMPTSIEEYTRYVDYYDHFYEYKHRVFKYEKYSGKSVLEIGCGLGIDTIKFARAGAKITAIDLSTTAVKSTQRLLEYYHTGAEVKKMSVEELDYADESFDAVYAYGVLMHVENEEKAVREIYRVLKYGGEALVVLYHRFSWYWLLVKLTRTKVESETGDPPVIRVHSVKGVRRLFRNFSKVEISLERFPQHTRRRRGIMAFLFNRFFVPAIEAVPKAWIRPFGWHIIVKAVKEGREGY